MGKRATHKKKLTELSVRKAKPKASTYQIWDSHQRGLALRIQPTGAKSWVCVYSRHGRSRWLTLGNADTIYLADARILAQEAMLAVAKGGDPAADKKAERGAGTFAELADKYVEQHSKRHNKSWQQADALVRRFAVPRWGKLQAAAITRGDVKTMLARIEAPVLANQTLAALSAIFSWGVREEIVTANPCKLIERNPVRSRERVLSASELPLFWNAFNDNEVGGVEGSALKAVLLTGQRPGEVAHMRREHIIDGWWEMPGAPIPELGWPGTKNGESHRVWLPQPVQALIGDAGTGLVFGTERGRPVRLGEAMRGICKKLGIDAKVTPHDLRRSHGSTVTGLGFGRDAMNRIQNHVEGGVTDTYDRHGYAEENKRIMEAVAAKIIGLAEGRGGDNILRPEFGR
jgi:integrase